MDLQTLRFFCVSAAEGSLTRAAKKLNYAQPNLSTRIRALEQELGAVLFERTADGVRLTAKGETLYDYAQRILRLADETENAVRDEGIPAGTLRLGSMESAAYSLLPRLLKEYHARCPRVKTVVHTLPSRQAVQETLEGLLDAAIIGGEVNDPRLNVVPLCQEELVLISFGRDDLDALLHRPLVVFPEGCSYRRRLEEVQARLGIMTGEIMDMNSLGAIFASVSAGLGVSLFPRSVLRALPEFGDLTVTELPDGLSDIPVSLVYCRSGHVPSAIAALASCFTHAINHISFI